MRQMAIGVIGAVLCLSSATAAVAQTWTGFYIGGSVGTGFQSGDASENVEFDTNLDGQFGDVIRTGLGADAFAPGFCGGLAVGATPAMGCDEDEDGIDVGGRVGYDWQRGRVVIGALVDVSKIDVIDSATAFSITPAFYAFTRELNYVGGLRARIGYGTDRVLVYATGGGAGGSIDQSFTTSNAVNTFVPAGDSGDDDGSDTMVWGYQAGAGVEIRFGARMSLVGEYLFTSLDNREESAIRVQGPAPATNPFILVNTAGTDLRRDDPFEFQAARIGLGVRF